MQSQQQRRWPAFRKKVRELFNALDSDESGVSVIHDPDVGEVVRIDKRMAKPYFGKKWRATIKSILSELWLVPVNGKDKDMSRDWAVKDDDGVVQLRLKKTPAAYVNKKLAQLRAKQKKRKQRKKRRLKAMTADAVPLDAIFNKGLACNKGQREKVKQLQKAIRPWILLERDATGAYIGQDVYDPARRTLLHVPSAKMEFDGAEVLLHGPPDSTLLHDVITDTLLMAQERQHAYAKETAIVLEDGRMYTLVGRSIELVGQLPRAALTDPNGERAKRRAEEAERIGKLKRGQVAAWKKVQDTTPLL